MSFNDRKLKKNKLSAMPEKEYDALIDLLYVQASSSNEKMIYHYLVNWLDERDIEHYTDAIGNLIATKGKAEIYPCIASHMDTVHDIKDDFSVVYHNDKRDGNLILSAMSIDKQAGVGGDDKCGIFACLYMLENMDICKAVFFTQEEVGCVGSSDIDMKHFDNVGYIIQLDRWGSHDLICEYMGQDTVNNDFLRIAKSIYKKYDYKSASGLITDSINLWDMGVGVSCVNVSCGYYEHHSNSEYIDVNELWNSIVFTKDLVYKLGCNTYSSKPIKVKLDRFSYDCDIEDYQYKHKEIQHYDSDLFYDAIDWDVCDWEVLNSILIESSLPADSIYDLDVNSYEAEMLEYEYRLRTNCNLLK